MSALNKIILRVLIASTLIIISMVEDSLGQNPDDNPLNTFTAGIGRAHDITSEGQLSNIGFDYLRRFNPKWEWGVQLDLDWTKDFIKFEGVTFTGIVAYSITQAWPLFAGVGVANEEHHTFGFFRMGTEYTFFFDSRNRYFIAPGTFIDIYSGGETVSLMVVLGITW